MTAHAMMDETVRVVTSMRKKKPVKPALLFQVEHVKLDELKAHPKNYVLHPDDELEHIATSIKQNGFYKNIVIARDNTILAGHGVAQAARKLDLETVPVVRLDLDPEDPRALKVLSGDNEIRHLAEVDDYALTQLLLEIKERDGALGLLGTGYDEMMIANLVFVTRPESEVKDFNTAAEWVGLPNYTPEQEPLRITVSFRSPADIKKFGKALGLDITEKTKAMWYPPKARDDIGSLKFQ